MKRLWSLILALGLAAAAYSPLAAAEVSRVVLFEYGIYAQQRVRTGTSPQGVPLFNTIRFRLVAATRRVPIRSGISFGIGFRILGKPEGAKVNFQKKWIFPEGGIRPPGRGVLHTLTLDRTYTIGHEYHEGWAFAKSKVPKWSWVPGKWVLQILYQGRVLLQQTFDLYWPDSKKG